MINAGTEIIVNLLNIAKNAGDYDQVGVRVNNNEDSLWMKPSSLLDLIEANHPDVVYTILAIR